MERDRNGAITVKWQRLCPTAAQPVRIYEGDAGFDLATIEDVTVKPHSIEEIRTGVAIALPEGFWARLVGRSSTRRRYGLVCLEGIIDNGYRGELVIVAQNIRSTGIHVEAGTRLAQLIPQRVEPTCWEESLELPESDRGQRGFGSTGK